MFRKRPPIEWPPEAVKWGRIDTFGNPVTPDSYTSIWVRVWRRVTRRGNGGATA